MTARSLPDRIVAIDAALADVPHAFGGALALAYHAEPRATRDIDCNVFVPATAADDVLGPLHALGADVDGAAALAQRDGQVRVMWDTTPVDLFFSYDAFHDAMEGAARTVPFADGTIRILSPEHLVVCKAVFDRSKDWSDIEQIMIGESVLDLGEILGWLQRILDSGDPRIDRIRKLWDRSR